MSLKANWTVEKKRLMNLKKEQEKLSKLKHSKKKKKRKGKKKRAGGKKMKTQWPMRQSIS